MPEIPRLPTRFFALLPLSALVIVCAVLALVQNTPAQAHHLCGNTGSPNGPFDLQTYEDRDYKTTYARAMELAGHNLLLYDRPTFAVPVLETGPRGAGSGQPTPPYVPPVFLKAIAYIESSWHQAASSVPAGQVGAALISHDCGYGLTQVTSGMQNVSGVPNMDQAMIGGHYAFNIARGARILAEKWNGAPEFRPMVGNRNPYILEDWYFALWAYNGFAFKNHPLNPQFNPQRQPYRCDGSQPRSEYPYQELVIGCAINPPSRDGIQLWSPQAVSLPNLSDPAFYDRLKLENWEPCSSQFQCAPMDIPTPGPWHDDPSRSGLSREQLFGTPQIATSTGAISFVAPPGGQSPNQSFLVGNNGGGPLSWRLNISAPWLRVSRLQGVALGGDLGRQDSTIVIAADASSLYPGKHTGYVTIESLYAFGSGTTIQVTVETADGALMRTPDGRIYVLQQGIKRHVPDLPTFESRGFSPGKVVSVPADWAAAIPTGHPLPSVLANGRLLWPNDGHIWVMENGTKRHVGSASVFGQCGYGSDAVATISIQSANAIPNGPPLTGPPCPRPSFPNGTLLRGSDGSVWVVQWNARKWVAGPDVVSNCGYHWGNLNDLGDSTIAQLTVSPELTGCTRNGSLLWTQDGRISFVRDGRLSHISDPLNFELSGFEWGRVAPAGAIALPAGDPLMNLSITGVLLRTSSDQSPTYVIDGATKRHIANPSIFDACGYSWATVSVLSPAAVNSLPTGSQLQAAPCPSLAVPFGSLLQQRNGAIWVTMGQARKWVSSPGAFTGCGYRTGSVSPVVDPLLRAHLPTASVTGCTEGSALVNSDGKVYVVRSGWRRHVPSPATLEALGISWANLIPTPTGWMPIARPLLDVAATGRLVRPPGDSVPVYVMEAGTKRHISSPDVFASCGYGWDAITVLSSATLAAFPNGPGVTGSPCPKPSFPDGTLLQQRNGAVWVTQANQRRWLTGPDAFSACGYRWADVDPVPDSIIAALPQTASLAGPPCP